MPIYTRTGDTGTTAVFGGKRLNKSDIQIEAYGQVDELTSFIGLVVAKTSHNDEKKLLTQIQISLYQIMGYLAGAKLDLKTGYSLVEGLSQEIKEFEQEIDKITNKLPKLTRFILPQGGEVASLYQIARTICRRAERAVVNFLFSQKKLSQGDGLVKMIAYLNRLSDLFFTLARKNTTGPEVVT